MIKLNSIQEIIKNTLYCYGKIKPALKSLTPRERKIIEMRYGLKNGIQHDLEDIGKEWDVTRERVRHIECQIMEKIQKFMTN